MDARLYVRKLNFGKVKRGDRWRKQEGKLFILIHIFIMEFFGSNASDKISFSKIGKSFKWTLAFSYKYLGIDCTPWKRTGYFELWSCELDSYNIEKNPLYRSIDHSWGGSSKPHHWPSASGSCWQIFSCNCVGLWTDLGDCRWPVTWFERVFCSSKWKHSGKTYKILLTTNSSCKRPPASLKQLDFKSLPWPCKKYLISEWILSIRFPPMTDPQDQDRIF